MDEKVKEQILAIRDTGLTNMFDVNEFGQRVRKCNDERACQENRRPECEDSFRKAMRM